MSDDAKCDVCGKDGRRPHNFLAPDGWLFFEAFDPETQDQGDSIVVSVCSEACARGIWKVGRGERYSTVPCAVCGVIYATHFMTADHAFVTKPKVQRSSPDAWPRSRCAELLRTFGWIDSDVGFDKAVESVLIIAQPSNHRANETKAARDREIWEARDREIWEARERGETVEDLGKRFDLRREKIVQICVLEQAKDQGCEAQDPPGAEEQVECPDCCGTGRQLGRQVRRGAPIGAGIAARRRRSVTTDESLGQLGIGVPTEDFEGPPTHSEHVLDSLKGAIRKQLPGRWAGVHGLLVAPDVFVQLQMTVPEDPALDLGGLMTRRPINSVRITVASWLPKGGIVPLDTEGRPMLKPKKEPGDPRA